MNEPKFLPPTLRERKRYLVFEITSEAEVEFTDLSNTIWNTLINFLGELGTSNTKIRIFKSTYDEKTKKGIIKCNHLSVENVRASLTIVNKIAGNEAIITVKGVSGTIKAARQKFFGERNLQSFT